MRFDDPNLVSCAGLAAVLALAARYGLATLLTERLRIAAKGGAKHTQRALAGRDDDVVVVLHVLGVHGRRDVQDKIAAAQGAPATFNPDRTTKRT